MKYLGSHLNKVTAKTPFQKKSHSKKYSQNLRPLHPHQHQHLLEAQPVSAVVQNLKAAYRLLMSVGATQSTEQSACKLKPSRAARLGDTHGLAVERLAFV